MDKNKVSLRFYNINVPCTRDAYVEEDEKYEKIPEK